MTTPINKTTPSAREIYIKACMKINPEFTSDVMNWAIDEMLRNNKEEGKLSIATMEAIKEVAQLSWEAADNYRHWCGTGVDEAPDKETFINNLMRE